MSKSLILSKDQISLKLDRMAWQIVEDHYLEQTLVVIGLESRGYSVAKKLTDRLSSISDLDINLSSISIDKEDPFTEEAKLQGEVPSENSAIILVDDVLNSGKTLAASLGAILKTNPRSIKTAVLANRDHHRFPIQANYVGISLATTLKEHISYEEDGDDMNVYLS